MYYHTVYDKKKCALDIRNWWCFVGRWHRFTSHVMYTGNVAVITLPGASYESYMTPLSRKQVTTERRVTCITDMDWLRTYVQFRLLIFIWQHLLLRYRYIFKVYRREWYNKWNTLRVLANTIIEDSSRLKIGVHERMQQYCLKLDCACLQVVYANLIFFPRYKRIWISLCKKQCR